MMNIAVDLQTTSSASTSSASSSLPSDIAAAMAAAVTVTAAGSELQPTARCVFIVWRQLSKRFTIKLRNSLK